MNEKVKRYILLIAVVVVWALIIYRVVSYVNPNPVDNQFYRDQTNDSFALSIDTFSLILNYPDPFFPEIENYANNNKQLNKTLLSSSVVVDKTKGTLWPEIIYRGTIKNPQTAKQVFLITISEKDFLMNISDTMMGVSMSKAYSDSVLLTFESNVKVFYKQK